MKNPFLLFNEESLFFSSTAAEEMMGLCLKGLSKLFAIAATAGAAIKLVTKTAATFHALVCTAFICCLCVLRKRSCIAIRVFFLEDSQQFFL